MDFDLTAAAAQGRRLSGSTVQSGSPAVRRGMGQFRWRGGRRIP